MPDPMIPTDLAAKLAAATERFHNSAQQSELTARMYQAAQNELSAAERDLRELGRAVALLRQHAPANAASSAIDEIVAKLRAVSGATPAPATNGTPLAPLSEVAKAIAEGDPAAEAALKFMLANPGQPVPGATT